jgi:hypothetical protein
VPDNGWRKRTSPSAPVTIPATTLAKTSSHCSCMTWTRSSQTTAVVSTNSSIQVISVRVSLFHTPQTECSFEPLRWIRELSFPSFACTLTECVDVATWFRQERCSLDLFSGDDDAAKKLAKAKDSAFLEGRILNVNIRFKSGGPTVLQAQIAPGPWPMFMASKQTKALAPEVYFHRLSKVDQARVLDLTTQVRTEERIAWLGAPGIGKSSAMNAVLAEQVKHLGEQGWPIEVALRVEAVITFYTYVQKTKCVLTRIEENIEYKDLFRISQDMAKLNPGRCVLLVELLEGEKEVRVAKRCASAFSISNNSANGDFKELDKSGLKWRLVDPMSRNEMQAAGMLLFWGGERLFGDTLDKVRQCIAERCDEVGEITRLVLCSSDDYNKRVSLQCSVQAQALFEDKFESNSVYSATKAAKLFMAPFVKDKDKDVVPDVSAETQLWEWRFLSLKRAQAAASLAEQLPTAVASLDKYGLLWQVQESLVAAALLGQLASGTVRSPYHLDLWEWFPDPGKDSLANKEPLDDPPADFVELAAVIEFEGRYLSAKVTNLKAGHLYRSTGWQTVLCEYLSVDHKNKTVSLYQVSTILPQNKGTKTRHVEEVRRRLQLAAAKYNLRLVYIVDASTKTKSIRGWAFEDEKKQVKQAKDLNAVEAFVVRAPITPGKLSRVAETFPPLGDSESWSSRSNNELKAELKRQDLIITGNKDALVARLRVSSRPSSQHILPDDAFSPSSTLPP